MGFYYFNRLCRFFLHNFDDVRRFRMRRFLSFCEDFLSALNHEHEDFLFVHTILRT